MKMFTDLDTYIRQPVHDGEASIIDRHAMYAGIEKRYLRYDVKLAPDKAVRGSFHSKEDAELFAQYLEHLPALTLTHDRITILLDALVTYKWHIGNPEERQQTMQQIQELRDILEACQTPVTSHDILEACQTPLDVTVTDGSFRGRYNLPDGPPEEITVNDPIEVQFISATRHIKTTRNTGCYASFVQPDKNKEE